MNAYAQLCDDGTVRLHVSGASIPLTRFVLRSQSRLDAAMQAHRRGWPEMAPDEFTMWSTDRLDELTAQAPDPTDPDPILTIENGNRQTETEARARKQGMIP